MIAASSSSSEQKLWFISKLRSLARSLARLLDLKAEPRERKRTLFFTSSLLKGSRPQASRKQVYLRVYEAHAQLYQSNRIKELNCRRRNWAESRKPGLREPRCSSNWLDASPGGLDSSFGQLHRLSSRPTRLLNVTWWLLNSSFFSTSKRKKKKNHSILLRPYSFIRLVVFSTSSRWAFQHGCFVCLLCCCAFILKVVASENKKKWTGDLHHLIKANISGSVLFCVCSYEDNVRRAGSYPLFKRI